MSCVAVSSLQTEQVITKKRRCDRYISEMDYVAASTSTDYSSIPTITGSEEPKITKPPETAEELLKEENELLRQIVHQNQQVLSRTAKIFEQNQQLIEMLMWERNKIDNTEFGDEFDWNDDRLDTEDEQEEDVEDINRFTSEEMNNMNTGSEPIVAEKEPETEHVEQIFVKCEPLSNDEEDEVMEMWTQKADIRETFSPTLSGPSTQPKATKPASPSIVNLQPEIDPRIISEGVAIFPISTLEELAKIGERMAKEEDFKQTILQYMERVKLNGDSISKLIKNVILARALKLKAADWTIKDVSRKLPFLEELQRVFPVLKMFRIRSP